LAAALAKKALELVSRSGQPKLQAIHKAKQHLNRWAEDASLLYGEGSDYKIPEGHLPLLRARARMYMRCTEPLNWAWHISRLQHMHPDLTLQALMGDPRSRTCLTWHNGAEGRSGRVDYMVELSQVQDEWGSTGTQPWREPCRAFWRLYCSQEYTFNETARRAYVPFLRVCGSYGYTLQKRILRVYAPCKDAFNNVRLAASCCTLYSEIAGHTTYDRIRGLGI
jgi:hypothetical protein